MLRQTLTVVLANSSGSPSALVAIVRVMETNYEAPQIVVLGSLADLTLNSGFGINDPLFHSNFEARS